MKFRQGDVYSSLIIYHDSDGCCSHIIFQPRNCFLKINKATILYRKTAKKNPSYSIKWNVNRQIFFKIIKLQFSLTLSFFRSEKNNRYLFKWCSCRLTVTQRVSLVEQELLSLPEHISSFSVGNNIRVDQSLVFCVTFCRSLFVLYSFFIWSFHWLSVDLIVTSKAKDYNTGDKLWIRKVVTTSETYPWSFVTQIFRNGQWSHGYDCKTTEVMTST